MSKTELQKESERRITVFKDSGQTQSKWSKQNALNLYQLRCWLKKMVKPILLS